MRDLDWEDFLQFLERMRESLKPGRTGIAATRQNLSDLIATKVLPKIPGDEHATLFPLGFSPADSDLKIAAGVGLERGLIAPAEYEAALRADRAASPFSFLQTLSGKTFGENIAPRIAQFWIERDGDLLQKQSKSRAL